MLARKLRFKHQQGQAATEAFLSMAVVFTFLIGAQVLWRSGELAQTAVDAVRFAAWERTVWEPMDNASEKFALHKTDKQLGNDVVLRQLSTPEAWRKFRAGLSSSGQPAEGSASERYKTLKHTIQHFLLAGWTDPNSMISVTTSSGWDDAAEGKFRGEDITYGKITSLDLDKETWRTAELTLTSQSQMRVFTPTSVRGSDKVVTKKKFSLITNSWAASPPVSFVRDRQLMPFQTGDSRSGTKGNQLGMALKHPWAIVGGAEGFGGQYLARQIGVNAAKANELVNSGGESYEFDFFRIGQSAGLMAETQQPEYFNPNAVSQWHHRHTLIIDETTEAKNEPDTKARNSNIGKLKYRAHTLQNPISTYFTR